MFLKLLDKHFPPNHKYRSIFNRQTIKISYSTTPNFKAIISRPKTPVIESVCNCRNPTNCPLAGSCNAKEVVYQAKVISASPSSRTETVKTYVGMTSCTFKKRFYNHTASFVNASKANNTKLSGHIWQLKETNTDYRIFWNILERSKSYINGSRRCDLCTAEKITILHATTPPSNCLNARTEIMTGCPHFGKFLLNRWSPPNILAPPIIGTPNLPRPPD